MTRILIVEDNPLNRDMLGRRLVRAGFAIATAPDGPSALAAVARERPDLVLMDIGLGDGITGWDVTRALKADPATAAVPVIALTARAFETDRAESLAAGCAEFETKPVDFPRLLEKIRALLPAEPLSPPLGRSFPRTRESGSPEIGASRSPLPRGRAVF